MLLNSHLQHLKGSNDLFNNHLRAQQQHANTVILVQFHVRENNRSFSNGFRTKWSNAERLHE